MSKMPKTKKENQKGGETCNENLFLKYNKFLLIGIIALVLLLNYFLIKPFFIAIISAITLTYIFYPLYKWVQRKVRNKNLAASIMILILLLILIIPLLFIIPTLSKQISLAYILTKQGLTSSISPMCGTNPTGLASVVCDVGTFISQIQADPQTKLYMNDILTDAYSFSIEKISQFVLSLPGIILNVFIMLFVMFYLFKDGGKISDYVLNILPFDKKHKESYIKRVNELSHATVYGHILVSIIQGLVGMIGFIIFDFPSPIVAGIVMVVLSILPFIGPWLLWIPVSIIRIINGIVEGNNNIVTSGAGLFIYGLIFISLIDNLIRPKIVGDRARIHPITALIGVIGGLMVFGFIGIFIGPLIMDILIAFIQVYVEDKRKVVI